MIRCAAPVLATIAMIGVALPVLGGEKRIVLIAGAPSHKPGEHEYYAGLVLLQRALNRVPDVHADVVSEWPRTSLLDRADAVVIYADGGERHPALQHNRMAALQAAMRRGCGLGCLHYAVVVPKDRGGAEFLQWIGGYYETHWSVNPFWKADFRDLPDHPITRGVRPFASYDEWYYHMRFVPAMNGVTPALSAHPPADSLRRPDGPHSGNPAVREAIRRGEIQHVAWAYERPDGGRGFGLTGGHAHEAWRNEDLRKLALNAILWIARGEVPAQGVPSCITEEEFTRNVKVE